MSEPILLQGWESLGFRCPDHKIDLLGKGNKPHHVTLVQMPNGTGKTTTLTLLRAALSGRELSTEEVKDLAGAGNSTQKGLFRVGLLAGEKLRTFELKCNFKTGECTYKTNLGKGQKDGFEPVPSLARILHPQFIKFFVFDGELADQLLKPQYTRAQEAIDALFQLDLLERLSSRFESHWTRHASQAEMKGKKAVSHRRNRWDRLKKRLQALEAERRKKKERSRECKADIDRLQKEMQDLLGKDSDSRKKLDEAAKRLAATEADLDTYGKDFLARLARPQALSGDFIIRLTELKKRLDKLQVPESTTREFFVELMDSPMCVCGRPIDSTAREEIRKRSETFLGKNFVGTLNHIKHDIGEHCGITPAEVDAQLEKALRDYDAVVERKQQAFTNSEILTAKLMKGAAAEVKEKQEECSRREAEKQALDLRLEELEAEPEGGEEDDTNCLKALRELCKQAEDEYTEASDTYELKLKTDLVQACLSGAQTKARAQIAAELVKEANGRLLELTKKSPVRLDSIEKALRLKGQGGASVGQTLAVAYSFLSTLFNRSMKRLPFVVDSPAGALDVAMRREVGDLLPKLTNQLIAFTTSGEREGLVDSIEDQTDDVRFMTLYRLNDVTRALHRGIKMGVALTDNGVVVDGRDFFMRFDVKKEA